MRPTALCLVLFSCACGTPRTSEPAPVTTTDDVHWLALTRDYQTATAYTGRTVRLHLARTEYACEGGTLKVWADDRGMVPPVLLIRLREPLPPALQGAALVVVGVCRGAVRDGTRRTARGVDFYVSVEDATATVR